MGHELGFLKNLLEFLAACLFCEFVETKGNLRVHSEIKQKTVKTNPSPRVCQGFDQLGKS